MAKTDKHSVPQVLKTGMAKIADMASSAKRRIPRRVWVASAFALLAVAIAANVWAFRLDLKVRQLKLPEAVARQVVNKPTLDQLKAAVAKDPKNAGAQLELGSAYWDAGKKESALASWDAALSLDPKLSNEAVANALVSCFGTPHQPVALAVIGKHKVMEAETGLRKLAGDKRFTVRQNALAALEKIGKAQKTDWVTMWIADTKEESCDVRRLAVEKLGEFGDKRALTAIREANKKDDEQTAWYQLSCLRSRPEEAEKKILARR